MPLWSCNGFTLKVDLIQKAMVTAKWCFNFQGTFKRPPLNRLLFITLDPFSTRRWVNKTRSTSECSFLGNYYEEYTSVTLSMNLKRIMHLKLWWTITSVETLILTWALPGILSLFSYFKRLIDWCSKFLNHLTVQGSCYWCFSWSWDHWYTWWTCVHVGIVYRY